MDRYHQYDVTPILLTLDLWVGYGEWLVVATIKRSIYGEWLLNCDTRMTVLNHGWRKLMRFLVEITEINYSFWLAKQKNNFQIFDTIEGNPHDALLFDSGEEKFYLHRVICSGSSRLNCFISTNKTTSSYGNARTLCRIEKLKRMKSAYVSRPITNDAKMGLKWMINACGREKEREREIETW